MFDNIFTDIRVQGEIKKSLIELEHFRRNVVNLICLLDIKIKNLK